MRAMAGAEVTGKPSQSIVCRRGGSGPGSPSQAFLPKASTDPGASPHSTSGPAQGPSTTILDDRKAPLLPLSTANAHRADGIGGILAM